MATLQVPLSIYQQPFDCQITRLSVTKDGERVLAGLSNGTILLFKWDPVHQKLIPYVHCIGPAAPITCLISYEIDLEDKRDGVDNVFVSISDAGDIALWSLLDGQCLQTRHERNDGVLGVLHQAKLHSSGMLVCYGECDSVVVLDGNSLEVLATFDLVGNWVLSLSLYRSDQKDVDIMIFLDADGILNKAKIDMNSLKCTKDKQSAALDGGQFSMDKVIDVCFNQFDPKIMFVLDTESCTIISEDLAVLAKISKLDANFQYAKFLSGRTVLVCDEAGNVFFYYLGPVSDIKHQSSETLNPRCIVLLSDQENAIYVDRLEIGPYSSYREATLIGKTSPTSKTHRYSTLCIPSCSSFSGQSLISFTKENFEAVQIEFSPYWASLFSSNMKPYASPSTLAGTLTSPLISFSTKSVSQLSSLWVIPKLDNPFTALVSVSRTDVAVGFASGDVGILSHVALLSENPFNWLACCRIVLKGHKSAVTALFSCELPRKTILFSGDRHGQVILWDLTMGSQLATFYDHSKPITRFIPVPPETVGKRTSILTFGVDNSLSLINVDDMTSLIFNGHKSIVAVHWRTTDHSVMVVECEDQSLFIWHLKSGYLDRIEKSIHVSEILASCEARVTLAQQAETLLVNKNLFSAAVFPIGQKDPNICVSLINIKRLIDEMNSGEVLNSPNTVNSAATANPPTPGILPSSHNETHSTNGRHYQNPLQHVINQSMDIFKKRHEALPASKDDYASSINDKESRGAKPDNIMVGTLVSSLFSWGLNQELDLFCMNDLKLKRPMSRLAGSRGAGGYLAFPIPPQDANGGLHNDWKISSAMSAQRILTIIALVKSLVANYNLPHDPAMLIRKFAEMVPEGHPDYYAPSLSMMIKFWQDSIGDIQEATRFLVSRSLTTLSTAKLTSLVDYWAKFIPVQEPIKSKTSCRAAVILGLVGSILPGCLSAKVSKDVCFSLEKIIMDPGKNPYRLLAIEIIGFGFKGWEPHLNGASMIRILVQMTGLKGQQQQQQNSSLISPPNMMMARQALMAIAGNNPGLFVGTLSLDLMHSKDVLDKVGALKLLGLFIAKKPSLLYPHLLGMVDAMVKMLDPNHPLIRESLQNIVTINFAELVKSFPMVAFHSGTQRLAVGTSDGTSVIYDLRTATKLNILEGHSSAVHGISFAPNGKLIATLAAIENQISFWQPSQGFLDSLKGAFGGVGGGGSSQSHIALPIGAGRLKPFRTFALGKPNRQIDISQALEYIKFEWTGDRSLRMFSIGIELAFNV